MSKVFSAHAVSVDGYISGRTPDGAEEFGRGLGDAADPWVDRSWATARADGSGRVYPNFPDPALDDWAAAYHAGNYPRLAAVKKAYDPHRFFDFPQAIQPGVTQLHYEVVR